MASQALVPVRKRERATDTAEDTTEVVDARESRQALLDETDALLDEIDAVLDMEAPAIKALTLGDLMRKGSTMNPQAIGAWETTQGETCALQAAFYAAKSENLI